jgi:COP9 signalosome complex subunit 2
MTQADLAHISYDFEYEDDEEDGEGDGDIDVENKYYQAKQLKGESPEEAITEFLDLPGLEPEKGDWCVGQNAETNSTVISNWGRVHRGFKGLKQATKLEFLLKRYNDVRRVLS